MAQDLGSTQKKLSEKVSELELGVTRLVQGLEQRFQGLAQQSSNTNELINALIELVGQEDVTNLVNSKRLAKAEQDAANEKAALERGIADRYVSAVDAVGERSIVVGCFLSADGTVDVPSRVQFPVTQIAENFKAKFLGATVGTTIPAENGKSYKILEIYNVDEDKARAVMQAKAQAAQQATQAAGVAASQDETTDTDMPPPSAETGSNDATAGT